MKNKKEGKNWVSEEKAKINSNENQGEERRRKAFVLRLRFNNKTTPTARVAVARSSTNFI